VGCIEGREVGCSKGGMVGRIEGSEDENLIGLANGCLEG
jgi:hypothetical protein